MHVIPFPAPLSSLSVYWFLYDWFESAWNIFSLYSCRVRTAFIISQGRPSLQADHADCVGPHLAEGASPRGGGLNWAANAAHLCTYAGKLVWLCTVSPLRGSTSSIPHNPRRRSWNRGPHHLTLRGASSWPGTALPALVGVFFSWHSDRK